MDDHALSVLIVDDEKPGREYVRDLVEEFAPSFRIAEASSAKKAKPILDEGDTDILFLDIKMREASGFNLLESLAGRDFELVFVTAYSEHTIQAIREGAADYILKPIDKAVFRQMLTRVTERRLEALKTQAIIANSRRAGDETYLDQKLTIHQHSGIRFILLRNIIYLNASNTYTDIHLAGGDVVTATKPISRFEELLDPHWFVRTHKSYMVNLHHFKEYVSENGDQIRMNDGVLLPVSRHRLSQFLKAAAVNSKALKL